MRTVLLDKIASVTSNCQLAREGRVSDELGCEEGDVIAVKVLTRKTTYNQLELASGRFCQLNPGDVIAGALGHRRALLGYAGHIPEQLEVGQEIDLLNLGGVLGMCDSIHPDLGPPFACEVLGQLLHFPYLGERIGVPANIKQGAKPFVEVIEVDVPVVAVVGTSMNSGKTVACHVLIQELVHAGLKVHAAKATGVSLRRDVLSMEDAGATETLTFTDLGVVTTTADNAPTITASLLTHLSRSRPDVIVLELGDGLLGEYGVEAILGDPDIRDAFTSVVLAASDPVGVWGGLHRLESDHGLKPTVVTGPATDNAAGTDLIRNRFEVPAANARMEPEAFARTVMDHIEKVVPREVL